MTKKIKDNLPYHLLVEMVSNPTQRRLLGITEKDLPPVDFGELPTEGLTNNPKTEFYGRYLFPNGWTASVVRIGLIWELMAGAPSTPIKSDGDIKNGDIFKARNREELIEILNSIKDIQNIIDDGDPLDLEFLIDMKLIEE